MSSSQSGTLCPQAEEGEPVNDSQPTSSLGVILVGGRLFVCRADGYSFAPAPVRGGVGLRTGLRSDMLS